MAKALRLLLTLALAWAITLPAYAATPVTLVDDSSASGKAVGTQTNPIITQGVGGAQTTNSANSTTSVLGNGGVFTGTSVDVSGYATINVSVFTDQASATNGLSMQQSSDGTNWDVTDTYTVAAQAAGGGKTYAVQVSAKYFRVVYTNGATPQTAFRLQTLLKIGMDPANSVRPQDAYSNENDVQQTEAFGMLYNGTTWDRARGDASVTGSNLVTPTPSASATSGLSTSASSAVASSLVLKGSAGNLFAVNVSSGASAGFVLIFNATSAPADGAVTPAKCYVLAANTTLALQWTTPVQFGTGITVVFSTTGCYTKTASATAFISGDYK